MEKEESNPILTLHVLAALVESVLFLQMEREFETKRAFMGSLTLVGTTLILTLTLTSLLLIGSFSLL